MPLLKRPDAELHYEVAGSGPALVFLHGLGGNHLSWSQQVAHFSTRHTCITMSHRGFFPSTAAAGAAGARAYADDFAALADHLKLETMALVCQSMGGWTGLEYALRHPGRVSLLVMACTSGTVDYRQLKYPGLDRLVVAWTEKAALASADLAKRGLSPAAGERMAREQPDLYRRYAEIGALTAAPWRERMRAEIFQLRNRSPEILAGLTMPVLYVVGDEDVLFPPDAAPALAARTLKGEHVRVPDAGHSVYFERAARFNQLVEEFLARAA
jgi:pimeloyl-ACP methyl ester carboxylesterase